MAKHPLCPISCPLFGTPSNYVPPSMGDGPSTVVHMGEAPGEDEDREGAPFVGKAGRLRDAILAMAKLPKPPTANIINCRPPSNALRGEPYEAGAIAACKVHRDRFIEQTKPDTILALGDVALFNLTGKSGITDLRGYQFKSTAYDGVNVIGTMHPSGLLRSRKEARAMAKGRAGMSLVQAVIFDMKLAPHRGPIVELVGKPNCTPAEFQQFMVDSVRAPFVVCDIETPRSAGKKKDENLEDPSFTIVRISFDNGSYAVSVPWQEPFVGMIIDFLSWAKDWVFWNWQYDVPRLRSSGAPVNGRIIDAMWLFALLFPDLPRGLDNVAPYYVNVEEWKSKSTSDPPYYSAMDSFVTRHNYVGIRRHLAERGMDRLAEERIKLQQILSRMGEKGALISSDRLIAFRSKLDGMLASIDAKVQPLWPEALHTYHPTNGYVRQPKDTTGMIVRMFNVVDKKTGVESVVERYAWRNRYNPLSPDDPKDYANYLGHTLTKTGKVMTSTQEKYLSVLLNRYKDQLYALTIEYRGINKLKGTYTEWPIGADGRIHTRYTFRPATGRLSSIAPNLQNIPHDEDDALAMEFRSLIIASPASATCPFLHPTYHPICNGHLLGRADYSGIEAVLTGWFASDIDYQRLAKLGVHAYATAAYLKSKGLLSVLPPTDAPDIKAFLKVVKSENTALYKKLKKCNHGINYGEGPDKMFTENPGMFADRREAREFHSFIKSLFSTVTNWQESTVRRAMKEHYLQNPFNRIRWFWDPSEDGPAAIAQLPQSTAADIIFRAMITVDEEHKRLAHFMIMQIHDELVFDLPIEYANEMMVEAAEVMETPLPELGGLRIGTSVTISDNLGS